MQAYRQRGCEASRGTNLQPLMRRRWISFSRSATTPPARRVLYGRDILRRLIGESPTPQQSKAQTMKFKEPIEKHLSGSTNGLVYFSAFRLHPSTILR